MPKVLKKTFNLLQHIHILNLLDGYIHVISTIKLLAVNIDHKLLGFDFHISKLCS